MATQEEIGRYYDTIATLHALRMKAAQGEYPDFTCAFFNGDFTKSYVQAQRDKHAWIFDGLGLGQNLARRKILDIGCGWGPILNAARERCGTALGFTLAEGQAHHCRTHGLNAQLRDYKTLSEGELGEFDGIISVGAFEHFCSIPEMLAGKQEDIYRNFFKLCASHLPRGGRLYLQTMTWGFEVPTYAKLSLTAPKGSREAILARMEYMYPGSWLPDSLLQIIECSKEYFDFISSNNGRLDYIETLRHWGEASQSLLHWPAIVGTLRQCFSLLLRLRSRDARIQLESILRDDQTRCFERSIMSHERIFFVRK